MVYKRIAALFPKGLTKWVARQFEYVGIDLNAQRFVGFILMFGFGLSIAVALNIYIIFKMPLDATIGSFAISFVVFAGGTFFWLNSTASSKGKFVEKIMPDALQLISSNMKAGLTTERALFVSARPEFGPLSLELKATSKRILSGERLSVALMGITRKIKSNILDRTIWLLTQGIKSGGQISGLLVELSDDLREENALKEEVKANVSMYVMLIFFSAAIGAPMLFGVSSYIVGVLSGQGPEDMGGAAAGGGMSMGSGGLIGGFIEGDSAKSEISEDFVVFFAEIALLVTSLFAGLVLGAINTGKELDGVRYMPLIGIVGFAVFFITRGMMDSLMGSFVTTMI